MKTQQLTEHLKLQLDTIKQLQQVLDVEKNALIKRQHELLESLAVQKEQLLIQLNECDQQVAQLLEQQSLPEQLSPLRTQISDTIEQCHIQNQANGRAIDLSINSLDRLQRSLIQKRSGNSMTYNAKGKTHGAKSSHGYISA